MPNTYAPPAISLLASSAPPAIARYQLRLNRRNGRTARATKELASISFIRMPLKNASGSQISEQTLFQKLSRTLRLLMNASTRSNSVFGGSARRPARAGSGRLAAVSASGRSSSRKASASASVASIVFIVIRVLQHPATGGPTPDCSAGAANLVLPLHRHLYGCQQTARDEITNPQR